MDSKNYVVMKWYGWFLKENSAVHQSINFAVWMSILDLTLQFKFENVDYQNKSVKLSNGLIVFLSPFPFSFTHFQISDQSYLRGKNQKCWAVLSLDFQFDLIAAGKFEMVKLIRLVSSRKYWIVFACYVWPRSNFCIKQILLYDR